MDEAGRPEVAARDQHAGPGDRLARDAHRHMLQFRLAGEGIGDRRRQRPGAGIGGEMRRSSASAGRPGRGRWRVGDAHLGAREAVAAVERCARSPSAEPSAPRRRPGCRSTTGSGALAIRRGTLPGAGHGVPLVAQAAGVERDRIGGVDGSAAPSWRTGTKRARPSGVGKRPSPSSRRRRSCAAPAPASWQRREGLVAGVGRCRPGRRCRTGARRRSRRPKARHARERSRPGVA